MAKVLGPFCSECGHTREQHTPTGCTVCECESRAPRQQVRANGTVNESYEGKWEDFKPGHQVNRTHGVGALINHHPEKVLPDVNDEIESKVISLRSEVMQLRAVRDLPFIEEVDEPEIRRLAKYDVIIRHLEEYATDVILGRAQVHGVPKGAPKTGIEALASTSVIGELGKAVQTASNISERLGLNPAGRYKLLKDAGWAQQLAGDRLAAMRTRGAEKLAQLRARSN